MPAWIITLLVSMAIKLGLPYLIKKLPWLPADVWGIIEEILKHIQGAEDKAAAVEKIGAAVRGCTGTGCPANTVSE